ncbi:MAG: hypothetical protein V1692_01250 [bacterium]
MVETAVDDKTKITTMEPSESNHYCYIFDKNIKDIMTMALEKILNGLKEGNSNAISRKINSMPRESETDKILFQKATEGYDKRVEDLEGLEAKEKDLYKTTKKILEDLNQLQPA